MTNPDSLNGIPPDKVRAILARDDLSIETLERMLSHTTDPAIVPLLLAAIDRLRAKAKKEVARLEEELKEARQRLQRLAVIHKRASKIK